MGYCFSLFVMMSKNGLNSVSLELYEVVSTMLFHSFTLAIPRHISVPVFTPLVYEFIRLSTEGAFFGA